MTSRPATIRELDTQQLVRLYGAWAKQTPTEVASLLADYPGLWWIAGGWAIEAFTGVPREHGDIDPCILRTDLSRLRDHLEGRLDLWCAASGALRPLLAGEAPLEGTSQIWTRPRAGEPWQHDILLAPGTDDEWVYRRDESIRLPMREALWAQDGILYLRPEIQLLYKAAGCRPKDQADFDVTAPLLAPERRAWLREQLLRTLPAHPWLARLRVRRTLGS